MATIMEKNDDTLIKDGILGKKEVEHYPCLELEERSLKAEARCLELESEIQKRLKEFEALESKFKQLESEKSAMENELKSLKQSKPTLDNVVDLTGVEEEDQIVELTMENRALEHEKKAAETEVEKWKSKFEKLRVLIQKFHEMGTVRDGKWIWDDNVKLELGLAGIEFPDGSGGKEIRFSVQPRSSDSLCIFTPDKDDALGKSTHAVFQCAKASGGQARKHLSFENDGENAGLLRLDNGKPASNATIVLCDSDEEAGNTAVCDSNRNKLKPDSGSEKQVDHVHGTGWSYEDEDFSLCEDNTTSLLACKRKRVICSDSESNDEDDIPICELKRLNTSNQEVKTPDKNFSDKCMRQRPVLLRQCKQMVNEERFASSEPNETEKLRGIPTTDHAENDESEERSESESDSLNGFIVDDDSNESAVDESDESTGNESDESDAQHESDEHVDYADVISRLRRTKNPGKSTWDYEGDMLADFGKDPELCMRAVCVLYRNQTPDEKASKSSHYYNQRGFSNFDAVRGTRLGEFLTDGDPNGDLRKTVDELRSIDAEAVEQCRELATKYSKQLFQIYKNKEDPFFAPP